MSIGGVLVAISVEKSLTDCCISDNQQLQIFAAVGSLEAYQYNKQPILMMNNDDV